MLGLLLCVCWASLLLVQIDSYRVMKPQKMPPIVDASLCNYREKETEARETSRQTYVVFIKQIESPTLCSAIEKTLPVAARFLTVFWHDCTSFQCRNCSEVQNNLFALVTCDLSNHNGGTYLMYKQWPRAQQNQHISSKPQKRTGYCSGKAKKKSKTASQNTRESLLSIFKANRRWIKSELAIELISGARKQMSCGKKQNSRKQQSTNCKWSVSG